MKSEGTISYRGYTIMFFSIEDAETKQIKYFCTTNHIYDTPENVGDYKSHKEKTDALKEAERHIDILIEEFN